MSIVLKTLERNKCHYGNMYVNTNANLKRFLIKSSKSDTSKIIR